jgi:phospho-N-acetylmuramoyl-pentapeptide-transferase
VFGVTGTWILNALVPGPIGDPILQVDRFRTFAFLVLFLGFALIGFIDDFVVPRMFKGKRGLGWKQKIVMQFAVAGAYTWMLGLGWSAIAAITVFDILFFSNAYNFADGLDWLAATLLLGFGAALAYVFPGTEMWALLGAILPFMYYNRPKARLFMGDVGSLPIGATLGSVIATITLLPGFFAQTHKLHGLLFSNWQICLAVTIASGMMIAELVPVPLQILSVKVRKKKLFSFTPIHHAYEKNGWPEGKVVFVFGLCQVLMSLCAITIFVLCGGWQRL